MCGTKKTMCKGFMTSRDFPAFSLLSQKHFLQGHSHVEIAKIADTTFLKVNLKKNWTPPIVFKFPAKRFQKF
jgi:hypothetical protein